MTDQAVTLLLIVWLLCGFASGAIASNKGLSFATYFFMGVILGVIGLIIAACAQRPVAPPPQPPSWQRDPWDPRMIRFWDGREWTYHTVPAPDAAQAG